MIENKNVLFVDDEVSILHALKRGVLNERFNPYFANSGIKALEIMSSKQISVIVTDMKMPGMDGLTLLKVVKDKYPDTVRMVLSAYTQVPQMLATINQVGIYRFITKPWKLETEFKNDIRSAISFYNSQKQEKSFKEALETKNNIYQSLLSTTSEKLLTSKADLENIKNININILNNIKKTVGDSKDLNFSAREDLLTKIASIEDLYHKCISSVLVKKQAGNSQNIVEEAKLRLLKEYINSKDLQ